MRWPWRRQIEEVTEHTAVSLVEAREKLRRAQQQTGAIVHRAEQLARELPPGEFVARVASAFRTPDH